jgi:hypothetical protein
MDYRLELVPILESTRVWLRRGTEIARTHTRFGRAEEVGLHVTTPPERMAGRRDCTIAQRCCDIFVAQGGEPKGSACCGYVNDHC